MWILKEKTTDINRVYINNNKVKVSYYPIIKVYIIYIKDKDKNEYNLEIELNEHIIYRIR